MKRDPQGQSCGSLFLALYSIGKETIRISVDKMSWKYIIKNW